MTFAIVSMFSVGQQSIVLLGHIIHVSSCDAARAYLPFSTQENEQRSTGFKEYIVQHISLKIQVYK